MSGVRQLQAGAGLVAAWWLREWQAALPEALRRGAASNAPRLVIRPDQAGATIALLGPRGDTLLREEIRAAADLPGELDRCRRRARRCDLVLALPAGDAIMHSLVVPAQARAQAEAIVRENVRRKTPFKLEEVELGYVVRPAGPGKLEIRYLVVPKSVLARHLDRLGIARAALSAVEGAVADGAPPVAIALDRPGNPSVPLARWLAVALVVVSAAAALAGFGALAWRQHERLGELEAQVAAVAKPARQSAERIRAVYGLAEEITRFTEQRQAPGIVQVWEELARVIPETTYLTEIEIRDRTVQIAGFSDAAPELIRLIETSPILSGAALAGPVVFDRAKGKEQFTLRATLRRARLAAEERD